MTEKDTLKELLTPFLTRIGISLQEVEVRDYPGATTAVCQLCWGSRENYVGFFFDKDGQFVNYDCG